MKKLLGIVVLGVSIGVTEAINLKNLGMYGVGNGMFESRYKQQATVTLNSCSGVLQCNFLKVLE